MLKRVQGEEKPVAPRVLAKRIAREVKEGKRDLPVYEELSLRPHWEADELIDGYCSPVDRPSGQGAVEPSFLIELGTLEGQNENVLDETFEENDDDRFGQNSVASRSHVRRVYAGDVSIFKHGAETAPSEGTFAFDTAHKEDSVRDIGATLAALQDEASKKKQELEFEKAKVMVKEADERFESLIKRRQAQVDDDRHAEAKLRLSLNSSTASNRSHERVLPFFPSEEEAYIAERELEFQKSQMPLDEDEEEHHRYSKRYHRTIGYDCSEDSVAMFQPRETEEELRQHGLCQMPHSLFLRLLDGESMLPNGGEWVIDVGADSDGSVRSASGAVLSKALDALKERHSVIMDCLQLEYQEHRERFNASVAAEEQKFAQRFTAIRRSKILRVGKRATLFSASSAVHNENLAESEGTRTPRSARSHADDSSSDGDLSPQRSDQTKSFDPLSADDGVEHQGAEASPIANVAASAETASLPSMLLQSPSNTDFTIQLTPTTPGKGTESPRSSSLTPSKPREPRSAGASRQASFVADARLHAQGERRGGSVTVIDASPTHRHSPITAPLSRQDSRASMRSISSIGSAASSSPALVGYVAEDCLANYVTFDVEIALVKELAALLPSRLPVSILRFMYVVFDMKEMDALFSAFHGFLNTVDEARVNLKEIWISRFDRIQNVYQRLMNENVLYRFPDLEAQMDLHDNRESNDIVIEVTGARLAEKVAALKEADERHLKELRDAIEEVVSGFSNVRYDLELIFDHCSFASDEVVAMMRADSLSQGINAYRRQQRKQEFRGALCRLNGLGLCRCKGVDPSALTKVLGSSRYTSTLTELSLHGTQVCSATLFTILDNLVAPQVAVGRSAAISKRRLSSISGKSTVSYMEESLDSRGVGVLRGLDLGHCGLQHRDHAGPICAALRDDRCRLEVLCLDGLAIPQGTGGLLVDAVKVCPTLLSLSLRFCPFVTAHFVKVIERILKPRLEKLTTEGARNRALAAFLMNTTAVEFLK